MLRIRWDLLADHVQLEPSGPGTLWSSKDLSSLSSWFQTRSCPVSFDIMALLLTAIFHSIE